MNIIAYAFKDLKTQKFRALLGVIGVAVSIFLLTSVSFLTDAVSSSYVDYLTTDAGGMDATVYSRQIDFKFVNDTPHYLLIETETDLAAGTVTFRFYSTETGRTVEMEGPFEANAIPHGPDIYREDPTLPKGKTKQVDWAHDGVDVTVYRIVKEGDKILWKDTFFSRYKPWQAVYLVGIGESS